MELVTIRQMQEADSRAVNEIGIPERELMYKAAESLVAVLSEKFELHGSKSLVFCGPGNNGGDGWAAACILYDKGSEVCIVSSQPPVRGGSSDFYAKAAKKKGIQVKENISEKELNKYDFIIDALFGIGLGREIEGVYRNYIELINNSECFVLSADIPSGLHSDEGVPNPVAVKADMTICFGRTKVSVLSEPGFLYAGDVVYSDIGIPESAYDETIFRTTGIDLVKKIYTKRKRTGFKGDYGKILIIAGSPGMTGAASLCAEACFRSGAGLVYNAVPESRKYEYESLVRESISIPVEDGGYEYVSNISAKDISLAAKGKTSVVIGPGLHQNSRSHEIFREIIAKTNIPIIVDARTLNDLADEKDTLKTASGRIILTPHPGEMARLVSTDVSEIQKNRISVAMKFAKEYGAIVLLKGHRTIITDGTTAWLNTTGNPGMATAGSGDVLCGIIAAALSYTSDLLEAAAAGTYIHGLAGDAAADRMGEYGMKSGDIISELPNIIKGITGD